MLADIENRSPRTSCLATLCLTLVALVGACQVEPSPLLEDEKSSQLDFVEVRVRLVQFSPNQAKSVALASREIRVWNSRDSAPTVARTDAAGEVDLLVLRDFDPLVDWMAIDVPGCQLWLERLLGNLADELPETPVFQLFAAQPIELSVVDERGKPVVDAEVRTTALGDQTYMRWDAVPAPLVSLLSARTDARGVARVRRGPPGQILWASAEIDGRVSVGESQVDWMPDRFVAKDQRIVLKPAVDATLRFVDPADGSPIPGVLVIPMTPQPEVLQVKSDVGGVVRFEGMAWSETPSFYVGFPQHGYGDVYLVGDAGPVPSGRLDLEVPLPAPVAVRGQVVDDQSGELLFTSFRVDYEAAHEVLPGWELRYGGRVFCRDPSTVVALNVPPGAVDFLVRSPGDRGRAAYESRLRREIREGESPIELGVERRPGILFRNRSDDPVVREAFDRWSILRISVGGPGSNQWSSASKGEFWFYPVDAWGDRLQVRAEWRHGQNSGPVLDREFEARSEDWPVVLDFDFQR